MFESFLVALDGSTTSNAGLRTALELARANAGKIIGLHVIDDRGILINIQDGQLPAKYFDKLSTRQCARMARRFSLRRNPRRAKRAYR